MASLTPYIVLHRHATPRHCHEIFILRRPNCWLVPLASVLSRQHERALNVKSLCYKPTAHCNESRDFIDLLEKFLLRRKFRPALQHRWGSKVERRLLVCDKAHCDVRLCVVVNLASQPLRLTWTRRRSSAHRVSDTTDATLQQQRRRDRPNTSLAPVIWTAKLDY